MSRPAVVFVEPDARLRKELSVGLARYGYEVVPAVTLEEGERYTAGLGPTVVVASADLPGYGDGAIVSRWEEAGDGGRSLVLLGRGGEDEATLPPTVRRVAVDGLDDDAVVRKIRLVLLGHEVGVETDPQVESLVGDLGQSPLLELVRRLHAARFSGTLELAAGSVDFERGEMVAARAAALGGAEGLAVGGRKALHRLARLHQGGFHVRPGQVALPAVHEALERRVEELVLEALEDASRGESPHPRARLEVRLGPAFFGTSFTPLEQQILELAQRGATAGAVLDRLTQSDGEVLATVESLVGRDLLELAEPAAALYVVTDSSADLPVELARAHGIQVVPLSVAFGQAAFHDGVDLRPKRFYELLLERPEHPVTAPPDESEFLLRYRELLARRDVVSVHLSEKMSQTVVHARQAADEVRARAGGGRGPASELLIVDSGSVSLGLGLLALFAARLAARGRTAREVAARLESIRPRLELLFAVDTLDFLRRGGRIGGARAWLGKLLGIKPILGVTGGEVMPVDRVRGGRAAHPRILELMAERADPGLPVIAGVAHANAPVWADRLRGLIEERFTVAEMVMSEMGPTVGTHAGPGAVGVVWFQPSADELELLAPPAD